MARIFLSLAVELGDKPKVLLCARDFDGDTMALATVAAAAAKEAVGVAALLSAFQADLRPAGASPDDRTTGSDRSPS